MNLHNEYKKNIQIILYINTSQQQIIQYLKKYNYYKILKHNTFAKHFT